MIENKCKNCHWKIDYKIPSTVLIDTLEKESAKYNTYTCTQCNKIAERIDKRTRKKVKEKYLLLANQRYLIGNRGNFVPYLVAENSLFIIQEKK